VSAVVASLATSLPIAPPLLDWQQRAGRHDLPWQQQRTAYRVWISEVMLQQTQVATVIPYYERFIDRFPDVRALAAALDDELLHLWSGLGYYARARNLKRAALQIVAEHGGEFPHDFHAVVALPGIGRSTAGAILAISTGQRFAILDGNVRRVLSRVFAVEGQPGAAAFEAALWEHAERETPQQGAGEYAQAIMDLGATVCVRRNPACERCPLASLCEARRLGRQHDFPAPRRAAGRRRRRTIVMLLLVRADGCVWLERRPPSGIWGGLWSPPEFADVGVALASAPANTSSAASRTLPIIEHAFTHFDLAIEPLLVDAPASTAAPGGVREPGEGVWYNPRAPQKLGLPAPVATLLASLPR
jgi:A/G-specific adenine glycosylase